MKKVHIGVIGCGAIAQIEHLPYLMELEQFELHSLCDLSRSVVDALGDKYGIPESGRYTNMEEMVQDPELDAVIICTKDHYEPGLCAARAGKHMLIEKPLAYNIKQAQEIVDEAKAHNAIVLVGYMKCYDPAYGYFQKKAKEMEKISLVRVHDFGGSFDSNNLIFNIIRGNDIPADVIEKGKADIDKAIADQLGAERAHLGPAYSLMLGLSTHDTILMRHIFGDPEILFCDVFQDTYIVSVLQYGDFRCLFESGLAMDRRDWDEKFSIYSPKKNMTLSFPWPYLKNHPTKVIVNENEPDSMVNVDKEVMAGFDESYRNELLHFYDCIVNGKTPVTNGEDAIKDIKLAYEMMMTVKL